MISLKDSNGNYSIEKEEMKTGWPGICCFPPMDL